MKLIRTSFIILSIVLWASAVGAQSETKCTLTAEQLSQAKQLNGFWPGMTVEQARAVVPSLEMGSSDEFGLSKTSFSPDFNPKIDKTAFQGVRTVSLDFLDGRVSSVWIGYNESSKWKTADEMVKAITESLKLPSALWETKGRGQQLVCGNLQFAVTMVAGSPTLRVTDETARAAWEKRRTEREESEP